MPTIEPSPVETKSYRVRPRGVVFQNGTRQAPGAVIQLSALQASDRQIVGHVDPVPDAAAAQSPAPPSAAEALKAEIAQDQAKLAALDSDRRGQE